jgi:electron transport complex protein RnfA
MQTITFILIIAALVQIVEIVLKKVSPALYQALGIYLPLITTNCAVLGIALLAVQKNYNLVSSVVYASATAVGFTLAMILMAGIREHMELTNTPEGMKGFPISLITAGLLSLAFMGFAGLV